MNVSEYIVDFLVNKGVKDFYGYQGTMIAYFIEAIYANEKARNHSAYNEQGAAFAACGAAKATGECAVAYATSGPGALNLVSGIADAFYDSCPVIFITGQINTTEYTKIDTLRQQGFQQTDVVGVTRPICKYAVKITEASQIPLEMEKAWKIANEGRKGPVVLDIPMDIQKTQIAEGTGTDTLDKIHEKFTNSEMICDIMSKVLESSRPVLMLGNGIAKDQGTRQLIRQLIEKLNIPVITSLPGLRHIDSQDPRNMGFMGAAYGIRSANIIAYKKADLILSLGSSMCRRQTGNPELFAQNAKIIRVDIDETELSRKVHQDDIAYVADVNQVIQDLVSYEGPQKDFSKWREICRICRVKTEEFNDACEARLPNKMIHAIGELFEHTVISVDVGQHMMWAGQSLNITKDRSVIFSGGHGAMGIALPAAIGAYYATDQKTVCIAGDGAFQMNIQELQWIVRDQIPVAIFVINNGVLGLIRQQQDDFFGSRYYGSSKEGGFTSPDFTAIAKAYGMEAYQVHTIEEIQQLKQAVTGDGPVLIEVMMPHETKAYPKTYFGQEMHNQRPELPDELMEYLLSL